MKSRKNPSSLVQIFAIFLLKRVGTYFHALIFDLKKFFGHKNDPLTSIKEKILFHFHTCFLDAAAPLSNNVCHFLLRNFCAQVLHAKKLVC